MSPRRHACRRRAAAVAALAAWLPASLAASGAAAQESDAPDGFAWRDGRPVLTALGGAFSASPVLRLDADAVSFFGQPRPGGFRSGANLRRARVGLEGGIGGALEYSFVWDFGGSAPNDWSSIYERQRPQRLELDLRGAGGLHRPRLGRGAARRLQAATPARVLRQLLRPAVP